LIVVISSAGFIRRLEELPKTEDLVTRQDKPGLGI